MKVLNFSKRRIQAHQNYTRKAMFPTLTIRVKGKAFPLQVWKALGHPGG
jgi:hypothetical protein